MDRRRFLASAAGALATASLPFRPFPSFAQDENFRATAIAGWRKRILSILGRGGLPIVDTQGTYRKGRTDVDQLLGHMKDFDVAQLAFAAVDGATSEASLELYRAYPEFFIPTGSSGESTRWSDDPVGFVDGVRKDLGTGRYFLMGEHEFRHYPSPNR